MKHIYLLILIAYCFQSCIESTDFHTKVKPIYSDFENDLERRNLYGRVKALVQYRVVLRNGKLSTTPMQTSSETFTDFGSKIKAEYFALDGKLTQTEQCFYDDKNLLKKSVSQDHVTNQKRVELISYDSTYKTSTINLVINDTIHYQYISIFDKHDLRLKQLIIEVKDTLIRNYEYELNENNKVIQEKEFEAGSQISSGTYKYDKDNHLIKYMKSFDGMEFLTELEWKNNQMLRQSEYTVSSVSNKDLNRLTEYDKQFNIVNEKFYDNSKLNREMHYEYDFDQSGNWIKRTISLKEHFANSDKFVPIYIESREIKYWY